MANISITPSNNLFDQLKSTPSDFLTKLYEFIDNSKASSSIGECNISIEVSGNWNDGGSKSLKKDNLAKIIITDDASGIPIEYLGTALSPAAAAGISKNSLHEHGMGLKFALLGLGTTTIKNEIGQVQAITGFKIITKTQNNVAHLIDKLYYSDNIETEEISNEVELKKLFPKGHGTIIEIYNLNNSVFSTRQQYSDTAISKLGKRYQENLAGKNDLLLKIVLKLTDKNHIPIKNVNGQEMVFNICPIIPEWKAGYEPKIKSLPIGKGGVFQQWSAEVKYGFNPTDGEVSLYNDPERKRILKTNHPYHNKNKKIDIFMNDVMICEKTLGWLLDIDEASADRYVRNEFPRIQIKLFNGFKTTFTKNDIDQTNNLSEIKEDVKTLLIKDGVLNDKYKPQLKAELEIRDKLAESLTEVGFEVEKEFSIEGLRADLKVSNKESTALWEIKAKQADAADIVQLYGYLEFNSLGIKDGVICCRELSDTAANLINLINKREAFNITFKSLDKLFM